MRHQVSIRLPARLIKELDRRARRRRRPRAEIIRDALTAYLELPEGALQARPVALVRGLLGAIDGLPADLATHAADYLDDLGRRCRKTRRFKLLPDR